MRDMSSWNGCHTTEDSSSLAEVKDDTLASTADTIFATLPGSVALGTASSVTLVGAAPTYFGELLATSGAVSALPRSAGCGDEE
jgi:hypothetical protein